MYEVKLSEHNYVCDLERLRRKENEYRMFDSQSKGKAIRSIHSCNNQGRRLLPGLAIGGRNPPTPSGIDYMGIQRSLINLVGILYT